MAGSDMPEQLSRNRPDWHRLAIWDKQNYLDCDPG
jgi:hypothetical protein